MITVVVNDVLHRMPPETVLSSVLRDVPTRGVAVAVNGEVVRRAEWPDHPLSEGDTVEVLTAVQGG